MSMFTFTSPAKTNQKRDVGKGVIGRDVVEWDVVIAIEKDGPSYPLQIFRHVRKDGDRVSYSV